jgi:hypothetical protein
MMRCRLNTAALGLFFATALAVTPALSAPNTTNQLADAETCKSLKTQLHSDRLREFAILGLLTVAEERGDAEEVWRFKRKLNSAGWYENIKSDAFYRVCPEAPIQ